MGILRNFYRKYEIFMGNIDAKDEAIIISLQNDATISVAAIGEQVGLSQNACWRRIKKLEDEGVLKNRAVLFDAEKLGYPLTVYALIRVREHSTEWLDALTEVLKDVPEIVEFHRMSGDLDYLAKILAKDMKHYDQIYKRIISIGSITDMSSSFLMEEIRSTSAIPIG
jgi:Lrp/AsnC family transcriptional regulator